MLEIVILIGLCRSMGKLLRDKGRKPLLFQVLVVVSWFGGELGGAIVGAVIHAVQHGDAVEPGLSVYLLALVGAVVGAGFWFLIAYMLPSEYAAASPAQQPMGSTFDYEVPDADPNNPYSPPRTRQ